MPQGLKLAVIRQCANSHAASFRGGTVIPRCARHWSASLLRRAVWAVKQGSCWRIRACPEQCCPGPRGAEHAVAVIAPWLIRVSGDCVSRIGQFIWDIYVGHESFAVAASAHIHSDGQVAIGRKEGMVSFAARTHHLGLAIGDLRQRGGHLFVRLQALQPGRQPDATRHRDLKVVSFHNFDL